MLLPYFVKNMFEKNATFDFKALEKSIYTAHKFLDSCVEEANLPHKFLTKELLLKRKRGLGFTGLASMFYMMGIKYGSDESIKLTEKISYTMAKFSLLASIRLAKERGPAPICLKTKKEKDQNYNIDHEFIDKFLGSPFYERLFNYAKHIEDIDWIDEVEKSIYNNGIRFTHGMAIAPTGTMSVVNNNMSSGIEPVFDLKGQRNVIVDTQSTKKLFNTFDFAFTQFVIKYYIEEGVYSKNQFTTYSMPEGFENKIKLFPLDSLLKDKYEHLKDVFITSRDLSTDDHLNILGIAAKFMDQSISKTINLSSKITFEEYRDIWIKAWKMEIKGITIFRSDPEQIAQVLVDQDQMANTLYEFTLENGSIIPLYGDKKVEYKGEIHNVTNLADAIQQGKYGANMINEELLSNEK